MPAPTTPPATAVQTTQAPPSVLMVRPHHYRFNAADCEDNAFLAAPALAEDDLAVAAHAEITAMAGALADRGVGVELFEDTGRTTPDSVFPNNWFSTHADGTLVLYPMRAPSRRAERRPDIIATLQERYAVSRLVDLTASEREGRFLEGTGAMVIDHVARVAYVARSQRTDASVLDVACRELGLTPVSFDAVGPGGSAIYHTNVLMSVGSTMALVSLTRSWGSRIAVVSG